MKTELEFKIHVPGFLKEVADNYPVNGGVLFIPFNVLRTYMQKIATRASQLNDPILNDIMCQGALYAISDPYDKENYNPELVREIKRKAEKATN